MKRAEYKVPGGKLLAAELGVEEGRLVGVKITGDFFMHPEAAIIELEKALDNIPIADLEDNVNRFFQEYEVTLFGVEAEDFVKVVRLALEP
ncbi:biotin--protein ligase [Candidatus Bathyarchaeota archaeon]|nr:biotin--protein ligase [Candidatus Bathyarchaeota archaeon]MCK4703433.1 biotin--protein ligase [Candidatus Bathyarchaeota archaeon]